MTMVVNYIVQRRRREKGKWWIGRGRRLDRVGPGVEVERARAMCWTAHSQGDGMLICRAGAARRQSQTKLWQTFMGRPEWQARLSGPRLPCGCQSWGWLGATAEPEMVGEHSFKLTVRARVLELGHGA